MSSLHKMVGSRCWSHPGILLLLAVAGLSSCSWIDRVSISTTGVQTNGQSIFSCVSGDGRYVGFQSQATNLVPGDVGGFTDIFVRDTVDNVTTRVSVDSFGNEANGASTGCDISADGRYVVFTSGASNLVSGDTNGVSDIFMHDRDIGKTTRVSVNSAGVQGDAASSGATMSKNGGFVAFASYATNLVSGDTLGYRDIFVRDQTTGSVVRVSVDSAGNQAQDDSSEPAISGGGKFVAFTSSAPNLVPGDSNNVDDIFVHDLDNLTTIRASVSTSGKQADAGSARPSMSAEGDAVAFMSYSDLLVAGDTNGLNDVFVRELNSGTTTRVSVSSTGAQGFQPHEGPEISSSGRYVTFYSASETLVSGDLPSTVDVFLHDRVTGVTTRESVKALGDPVNSIFGGFLPTFSDNERHLAMASVASLIDGDTNGQADIYLRAIPPITVNSAVPNMLPSGATTSITITGANFLPGSAPRIHNYMIEYSILDENTITAMVTVPSTANPGNYHVEILRPGTGPGGIVGGVSGRCTDCVTVF